MLYQLRCRPGSHSPILPMIATRQQCCAVFGWSPREFDRNVASGMPAKKRSGARGIGTSAVPKSDHTPATLPEVRSVKATAAAIEAFVKASKGSEEAILVAQTIKARADRKTAEAYKELEKAKAGRPKEIGVKSTPISGPATLAELGIDKNEAKRLRALGAASKEQFEAGLAASAAGRAA